MTPTKKQSSTDSKRVEAKQERRTRSKLVKIVLDNFVWILVIAIMIVAFFTTPEFFKSSNLVNLLIQSVMLGMLVLGESICLISGNFDMSIEGILIFTAVWAAWLITPHEAASGLDMNPYLGIVAMLSTGGLIGAVNGFLISYVKMNAFITTLAMTIFLIGFCTTISAGNTLAPFPDEYTFFGDGKVGPFPAPIILLIVVYLLFGYILTRTTFGRKLFAVGGNKNAAQASGINVKRIVFYAYVLSGVLSSLGGLVLSGRMGAAVSHMTRGNLLQAFAAAVIGGVSPFGGQGRIISVFGGVILLMTITKLLVIAHVNPFLITGAQGAIVFIAMLILTIKQNLVLEE